jgi:hypothetical protein
MPMKNSNDTIGNRSRDLLVCSTVPQQLRHRVGVIKCYYVRINGTKSDEACCLLEFEVVQPGPLLQVFRKRVHLQLHGRTLKMKAKVYFEMFSPFSIL